MHFGVARRLAEPVHADAAAGNSRQAYDNERRLPCPIWRTSAGETLANLYARHSERRPQSCSAQDVPVRPGVGHWTVLRHTLLALARREARFVIKDASDAND